MTSRFFYRPVALACFVILSCFVFAGAFAQDINDRKKENDSPKLLTGKESDTEGLRTELESGVVIFGKPHRFAEIGATNSFDTSPDGRTLVFPSGGKLKFFDLVDNKVSAEFGEPNEQYRIANFSPDGRYVFAYAMGTSMQPGASMPTSIIRVFDAIDHSSVGTISTEAERNEKQKNAYFYIQKLVVSADAKYVGLQGYNEIQVREVESGEVAMRLTDIGYVQSMAFSPDESELLIPAQGKMKVYDIESGEAKKKADSKLVNQRTQFVVVNLSRNLVALPQGSNVVLHDLESGSTSTINLKSSYAQNVAFSDDGSMLAMNSWSRGKDGQSKMVIHIVDVDKKAVTKTLDISNNGISKIAFSVDGKSLFISGNGIFGVQEFKLGEEQQQTDTKYPAGPVNLAAIHPDGESFVTSTSAGELTWFETKSGKVLRSIHKHSVGSIQFTDDGKDLIVSSRWGSQQPISRLSYKTGKSKKEYAIKTSKKSDVFSQIKRFMTRGGPDVSVHSQHAPISVKLSEDETELHMLILEMNYRMVAAGLGTQPTQEQEFLLGYLKLDAETGKCLESAKYNIQDYGFSEREWVQQGAINPDGSQFATFKSKHIFVAETATGEILEKVGVDGHVSNFDYSPDGRFLYATTHTGTSIWETETFSEVKVIEGRGNPRVTFSKNSERMAVCMLGSNSKVDVYETESWKKVKELDKGHGNRQSISFSDDGSKLLIGLSDCRMELWDLALVK